MAPRVDVKRLWVEELAETEAEAAEMLNGARRDHAEAEVRRRSGRVGGGSEVRGYGSQTVLCVALVYQP